MKYFALGVMALLACLFAMPEKSDAGLFSRRQQVVIQNGNCGLNNQRVVVQQRRGFFGSRRQNVVIQNGFRRGRSQRVLVVPQSFGFQRRGFGGVQNNFRIEIDD